MSTAATGNLFPTLEQRLTPAIARSNALFDLLMQSARVALPGIVQSFSVGPPVTVSVLVTTNEFVTQNTGDNSIVLSTVSTQLPLLQDVPVHIPGGGNWSLTFPIEAGDECLVVFCDTPIDVWLQNGGVSNSPISQRRHSLSDGMAFMKFRSRPNSLSNYSTTSAQLRNNNGTVIADFADAQITITAPAATVNCTGEVTVTADKATITATTSISLSGTAPFVPITSIDGKGFLPHIHTVGTGFTGPVVTP